MKMKNVVAVTATVALIVVACQKESALDTQTAEGSLSNASTSLSNSRNNMGSGKDTCIHLNGRDSCFKIPVYSDTTHQGGGRDSSTTGGYHPVDSSYHGGHGDSTYYPGYKDTCIKYNGRDTCFRIRYQ